MEEQNGSQRPASSEHRFYAAPASVKRCILPASPNLNSLPIPVQYVATLQRERVYARSLHVRTIDIWPHGMDRHQRRLEYRRHSGLETGDSR